MKYATLLTSALLVLRGSVAIAQQPPDLFDLSLEELLDVKVTAASRKEQTIRETAAAVYVISSHDIRRAGATNLADVLRMVPGFSVGQLNANTWSIAARGFGGKHANKVLVMIDGRSIYTPLNGGVNWEMQLLPLDAIEQIEIVRGPGGSLWGANAINGVINIITKPAYQARGGRVATRVGASEPGTFDARYGDRLGEAGNYVFEGRYSQRRSLGTTAEFRRGDDLAAAYGRARMDWTSGASRFSFQADVADGKGERVAPTRQLAPPFDGVAQEHRSFTAGNSMLSWTQAKSSGVENSLQVYYSGFARSELGEKSHTIDVDTRQRRDVGKRHDLVGGLGYRFTNSVVEPTRTITITPGAVRTHLVTAFFQDEISLASRLQVTAGTKVEANQDTGFEVQPSVRVLWRPVTEQSVWGAVTRAVRTPNRFERGMQIIAAASQGQGPLPVVVRLQGSPETSSEIVTAYEAGYRVARGAFSVDVTAFAGSYDDLATLKRGTPGPGRVWDTPVFIVPMIARNDGMATTRGAEVTSTWKPRSWWQLAGSCSWLQVNLGLQSPDGSSVSSVPINGPVPGHNVHVRNSVSLPRGVEASALFYHVSEVPAINIAAYERLDLRVSWTAHRRLELAAGVQNLLHDAATEYADRTAGVVAAPVRSSAYGELAWRF